MLDQFILQYKFILGLGAVLTPFLSAYFTYLKIKSASNALLEKRIKEIIELSTKTQLSLFEEQVSNVKKDIKNVEDRVEKDLTNIRSVVNTEVKNLSTHIDAVREDGRIHHAQTIQILTKLISK